MPCTVLPIPTVISLKLDLIACSVAPTLPPVPYPKARRPVRDHQWLPPGPHARGARGVGRDQRGVGAGGAAAAHHGAGGCVLACKQPSGRWKVLQLPLLILLQHFCGTGGRAVVSVAMLEQQLRHLSACARAHTAERYVLFTIAHVGLGRVGGSLSRDGWCSQRVIAGGIRRA